MSFAAPSSGAFAPPGEQMPLPTSLRRLACRVALSLPRAGFGERVRGHAGELYPIDQRFGSIAFSVDHLGLISTHGRFRRFEGTLFIDPVRPARSHVAVTIAADSAEMAWHEGTEMLRSPAYFDVRRHPDIGFRSTEFSATGGAGYAIRGVLEMRGVARALTLDANVVSRRDDAVFGTELADVVLTGALRRSAFGMLADQALVSDRIDIEIRARIQLGATGFRITPGAPASAS